MLDLLKRIRNTISSLELGILLCLIVFDSHTHDVVEIMIKVEVEPVPAFICLLHIRCYCENGVALLRMLTYKVLYGNEYLANISQLVIILLTDR
jgi:hypothetical protein